MDVIIKQFKEDFKARFGVELSSSDLLNFVSVELESRKGSMIKDSLLGRTTSDLVAIALVLESDKKKKKH